MCYGISPPAERLRSIVELFLLEESVGHDSFSDERHRVTGREWPRGTSGPLVLAHSLFARLLFPFLKKEGKCASAWILSNV